MLPPIPPSAPIPSPLPPSLGGLGNTIGDASGLSSSGGGHWAGRKLSERAADNFNARDYGAVGKGVSRTAAAALGITTLAGLANWAAPDGSKPYSFIAAYPFGVLFNLNLEADAASGASALAFQASGTVGVQIPTTLAAASGATSVVVGDKFVTADATPIAAGTPVSGVGIAAGTTVTAVSGYPGSWTLTLSTTITAAIASGAFLTFSVQPASGSYTLPVIFTAGIHQGDTVAGAGIAAGTQVDHVNPSKMEITLSKPTAAMMVAGQGLTFIPFWLANVQVGMQVSGPGIAAGTTVSAVNAVAGAVNLSTATTAAMTARSALTGTVVGTNPTTPVTFYRPYTDAEAAALEMDRLGIQAAINAANAGIGGDVYLAPGGNYRIDGPIILPIFPPYGEVQAKVSIGGATGSVNGAVLLITKDFGPGTAALSCGDPTAKSANGRGLYQGSAGYFASGRLHDLRMEPLSGYVFKYGLRPTWGGTPVAMDGIKVGPRLHHDRVLVRGFNHGMLAAFDHTTLSHTTLVENFIGLRLDDQQPNLFGDEIFDRLQSYGNAWAGISISPKAYFNGEMRKPYLGNNPWAIWLEPGANAGQGMQGATIVNGNLENSGLGIIKDGGIRDGWVAAGGTRSLNNVRITNTFHGGLGAFGAANIPTPVGGGQWAAYFDVAYASDFVLDNVWTNDFPPVANAFAHVLRVRRLDGFGAAGFGGFRMSGNGVLTAINNARSYGQNIVSGPNGFGGDFWYTGAWQYVTLEGPTFRARPMPFLDASATSVPLGTLLEYGTSGLDGLLGVQRAGQTAGAAIAGVSMHPDWGVNPATQQLALVVAVAGSRVPMRTIATATLGQMLKASTTTFGSAVSSTGITDGPAAGVSMGAGTSSTLTYVRPLWAGQF